VAAVGVSQVDIQDFASFDDSPVRILFMIAAAYNQHAYYLQTLSYFSARFKSQELRESVLAAGSTERVYELLTKAEE